MLKINSCRLMLFTVLALITIQAISHTALAQVGMALPIRDRMQWGEKKGYCGETSVQECALYYGIYASQAYIRATFDPTQENDLVEIEEFNVVFNNLGLKAEYFPTETVPQPQYKTFSAWAKRHLYLRRPVICGVYLLGPSGETPSSVPLPFDHIVTLTNFASRSLSTHRETDVFALNLHWLGLTISQSAKWLFDSREMNGPGKDYEFAIPKEVNYGIAIKGITNEDTSARPVRIELDNAMEPNLIVGENAGTFQAEITVESLTPGRSYVIYRYNDPTKVPMKKPAAGATEPLSVFAPQSTTHTIYDTISSEGATIYRCFPVSR